MPIAGMPDSGAFANSKVASRKVMSDSKGNLNIDKTGNHSKAHKGLKSGTKHTTNPTSSSGNTSAKMGSHSLDGAASNGKC